FLGVGLVEAGGDLAAGILLEAHTGAKAEAAARAYFLAGSPPASFLAASPAAAAYVASSSGVFSATEGENGEGKGALLPSILASWFAFSTLPGNVKLKTGPGWVSCFTVMGRGLLMTTFTVSSLPDLVRVTVTSLKAAAVDSLVTSETFTLARARFCFSS